MESSSIINLAISSDDSSNVDEVKVNGETTILVSRQDVFYDDELEQED